METKTDMLIFVSVPDLPAINFTAILDLLHPTATLCYRYNQKYYYDIRMLNSVDFEDSPGWAFATLETYDPSH